MAGIIYPQINGFRYAWASIVVTVGASPSPGLLPGNALLGIKAIKYSDSLKRTKMRGAGVQPRGRSKGPYDATASIEVYLEEYDAMVQQLGGDGFMEASFDLAVAYGEGLAGHNRRDIIRGCTIVKNDASRTETSGDPSTMNLDLDPMGILWNGFAPISNMIGMGNI